jgi:hypothetical protein
MLAERLVDLFQFAQLPSAAVFKEAVNRRLDGLKINARTYIP